MFDKLGSTTNADVQAAEHAFAFRGHIRVFLVPLLDIDIEAFALEEELEVRVVLQDQMIGGPSKHSLQRKSTTFYEILLEAANSLLVWWRWDDCAWVVVM